MSEIEIEREREREREIGRTELVTKNERERKCAGVVICIHERSAPSRNENVAPKAVVIIAKRRSLPTPDVRSSIVIGFHLAPAWSPRPEASRLYKRSLADGDVKATREPMRVRHLDSVSFVSPRFLCRDFSAFFPLIGLLFFKGSFHKYLIA